MNLKLPTLKAIMAENKCDINAARSIRARMEVEADRAHFRKTGKHALEVISAHDLARHPELAVQDTPRLKLTEWTVEKELKTTEERLAYVRAAAEEGSLSSVFDAFADVFRSMGKPVEAMACDGLAASLSANGAARPRKTTKREPAMA